MTALTWVWAKTHQIAGFGQQDAGVSDHGHGLADCTTGTNAPRSFRKGVVALAGFSPHDTKIKTYD
jgi:hypothetical protein